MKKQTNSDYLDYLFEFANLDFSSIEQANQFFRSWNLRKQETYNSFTEMLNDSLRGIRSWQKALRKVFDNIIEKQALTDSEVLRSFERIHRSIPRRIFWTIVEGKKLDLSFNPPQNWVPELPDFYGYNLAGGYLEKVARSLFQFLSMEEILRIRKCKICEKYFVAKDKKRQKCYSDDCRKEYEKVKKQKQREKDPVKYY